jgi:hypothetical protein
MQQAVTSSTLYPKYAESVDRESAREKLAAKLEAGAEKAHAEQEATRAAEEKASTEDRLREEGDRATAKPRGRAPKKEKSMVEEVVGSTMFRQVARTAAREIVRGMFGTGRRR